jgi:hypothetical protein
VQNYETLAALRDMLLEVHRQMVSGGEEVTNDQTQQVRTFQTKQNKCSKLLLQLFERHLFLVHFCALRKALSLLAEQQQQNGVEIAPNVQALRLRLSIAMLR